MERARLALNLDELYERGDARTHLLHALSGLRLALLPGVKTIASQGVPGYDSEGWFVLAAPKGLPAPIAAKLNEALNAALAKAGDYVASGPTLR